MSEGERFERILASLHEAALDRTRWPCASALIDEVLGTHGNTLACGDGGSDEDYRLYFMWIYLRGQRHRELEQLWFGTYYPVDERIPRLRRLPFNQLFHITDLYTEEDAEGLRGLRCDPDFRPCRERDRCASGRTRRLAHLVGDQRPRRRRKLVVCSARHDSASPAPCPPDRACPADAGPRGCPGCDAEGAARRHRAGCHPAGSTRTDRGDERPRPGPAADWQRAARQRRILVRPRGPGQRRPPATSEPRPAAVRSAGFWRLDDREPLRGPVTARVARQPGVAVKRRTSRPGRSLHWCCWSTLQAGPTSIPPWLRRR